MYYLEPNELSALLAVAYGRNKMHHMAMLTTVCHGLRVNEICKFTTGKIQGEYILCARSKHSLQQLQPIHASENPVFDERGIRLLIPAADGRLFPISRQRFDQVIKMYGRMAGLPEAKCHWHALKHTTGMMIWNESRSLGEVTQGLGHKSPSSAIIYLREAEAKKATNSLTAAMAKL